MNFKDSAAFALESERLRIWSPTAKSDPAMYARYFDDNRAYLDRWSPALPDAMSTIDGMVDMLELWQREREAGEGFVFAVAQKSKPDRIAGFVRYSQIVRGFSLSCKVGFSVDQTMQGRGFASEAVATTIPFMFDKFHLHRISATYDPNNHRSAGVLRKVGFVVEGYARNYLFVNGCWRDHVLVGLINPRNLDPVGDTAETPTYTPTHQNIAKAANTGTYVATSHETRAPTIRTATAQTTTRAETADDG